MEGRLHGTVRADGNAQGQLAEMLRLQANDHLRVVQGTQKTCLLDNLTRDLIVGLRALRHLCGGCCLLRLDGGRPRLHRGRLNGRLRRAHRRLKGDVLMRRCGLGWDGALHRLLVLLRALSAHVTLHCIVAHRTLCENIEGARCGLRFLGQFLSDQRGRTLPLRQGLLLLHRGNGRCLYRGLLHNRRLRSGLQYGSLLCDSSRLLCRCCGNGFRLHDGLQYGCLIRHRRRILRRRQCCCLKCRTQLCGHCRIERCETRRRSGRCIRLCQHDSGIRRLLCQRFTGKSTEKRIPLFIGLRHLLQQMFDRRLQLRITQLLSSQPIAFEDIRQSRRQFPLRRSALHGNLLHIRRQECCEHGCRRCGGYGCVLGGHVLQGVALPFCHRHGRCFFHILCVLRRPVRPRRRRLILYSRR